MDNLPAGEVAVLRLLVVDKLLFNFLDLSFIIIIIIIYEVYCLILNKKTNSEIS
jgi:hypothetical protein